MRIGLVRNSKNYIKGGIDISLARFNFQLSAKQKHRYVDRHGECNTYFGNFHRFS